MSGQGPLLGRSELCDLSWKGTDNRQNYHIKGRQQRSRLAGWQSVPLLASFASRELLISRRWLPDPAALTACRSKSEQISV